MEILSQVTGLLGSQNIPVGEQFFPRRNFRERI